MSGPNFVNSVCWLPKVNPGESASSTPAVAPRGTPQQDQAQWSVTVHRDFIEGTTGTPGATNGGTISARFDRRNRQATTTSDLRMMGIGPGPQTKPGGIAQLRRAVEACAAREAGTDKAPVLREALQELAAADPASTKRP